MFRHLTKAIDRALRLPHSNRTVDIRDVVVALQLMLPQAEINEAVVTMHLADMISGGYEPPVKVVQS